MCNHILYALIDDLFELPRREIMAREAGCGRHSVADSVLPRRAGLGWLEFGGNFCERVKISIDRKFTCMYGNKKT